MKGFAGWDAEEKRSGVGVRVGVRVGVKVFLFLVSLATLLISCYVSYKHSISTAT